MLVIPQEFISDSQVKQRSLPQFLDTFCTEPRAGWKQWLSIGLETTTQMGDNVFPGTLEFPSLPTTGSTTLLAMSATPSPGSIAPSGGRDQDRPTRKWSSQDSSPVPPKRPWGDSSTSRVSFTDASNFGLGTKHSRRFLSSPLTQMGIHPWVSHLGSGNSTPCPSPGYPKTLEKMHNEVALLWAAHRDYMQGLI